MTNRLLGKTIGGYKIIEKIGSGGIATVYKAYQSTLNRWVAIKILHHRDQDSSVRFKREAKAIAALRHRNILHVYDFGEADGRLYMVMEYIENGSLAEHLKGQPMGWQRAVSLLLPLANVLQYAHDKGVIHRDVKPSNILLSHKNWPLLADFGLVKLSEYWDDDHSTGTEVSLGTPAYVSPEQARGVEIDHRADIYSLGIVLFEMITGRPPFVYSNANKTLMAHLSEAVPSPKQFSHTCPPGLEQIILVALQKSPEQRYPTMQALADALKTLPVSSTKKRLLESGTIIMDKVEKERIYASSRPAALQRQPNPLPYIIIDDSRAMIQLPKKHALIIGRTHRNTVADIDLGVHGAKEAGVSRHHAKLMKKDGQWFIEDLKSLNGTFINNIKILPSQPILLKDGDIIRCSHLSFTFYSQ